VMLACPCPVSVEVSLRQESEQGMRGGEVIWWVKPTSGVGLGGSGSERSQAKKGNDFESSSLRMRQLVNAVAAERRLGAPRPQRWMSH